MCTGSSEDTPVVGRDTLEILTETKQRQFIKEASLNLVNSVLSVTYVQDIC